MNNTKDSSETIEKEGENWQKVQNNVWKPLKMEAISGVFHQKEVEIGKNKAVLYTFHTKTEGFIKVFGTKILDNLLQEIEVGKIVKIIYLGTIAPEKGRPYHDWEVYVKEGL